MQRLGIIIVVIITIIIIIVIRLRFWVEWVEYSESVTFVVDAWLDCCELLQSPNDSINEIFDSEALDSNSFSATIGVVSAILLPFFSFFLYIYFIFQ